MYFEMINVERPPTITEFGQLLDKGTQVDFHKNNECLLQQLNKKNFSRGKQGTWNYFRDLAGY